MLRIKSIKKISSNRPHSAFTDLVACGSDLLCCYRQGQSHISPDGRIEISRLTKSGQQVHRQWLQQAGVDLRDPKLIQLENGTFMLSAYGKQCDPKLSPTPTKMLRWFSTDGHSWSSAHYFGPSHWWLWRLRQHHGDCYALAYNRKAQRIDLYRGEAKKHWFCIKKGILSLAQHQKGYPNESDLWFDEKDTIHALVRRDADSFSALLGTSKPPYTRWHWQDLHQYIGGPVTTQLTANTQLVGGRIWTGKAFFTQLWTVNNHSGELTEIIKLPSGGDNSYPGLVIDGDTLYVSYYSSHSNNQSCVYLATLSGIQALRNIIK
jgi:hypothetical protein